MPGVCPDLFARVCELSLSSDVFRLKHERREASYSVSNLSISTCTLVVMCLRNRLIKFTLFPLLFPLGLVKLHFVNHASNLSIGNVCIWALRNSFISFFLGAILA